MPRMRKHEMIPTGDTRTKPPVCSVSRQDESISTCFVVHSGRLGPTRCKSLSSNIRGEDYTPVLTACEFSFAVTGSCMYEWRRNSPTPHSTSTVCYWMRALRRLCTTVVYPRGVTRFDAIHKKKISSFASTLWL